MVDQDIIKEMVDKQMVKITRELWIVEMLLHGREYLKYTAIWEY